MKSLTGMFVFSSSLSRVCVCVWTCNSSSPTHTTRRLRSSIGSPAPPLQPRNSCTTARSRGSGGGCCGGKRFGEEQMACIIAPCASASSPGSRSSSSSRSATLHSLNRSKSSGPQQRIVHSSMIFLHACNNAVEFGTWHRPRTSMAKMRRHTISITASGAGISAKRSLLDDLHLRLSSSSTAPSPPPIQTGNNPCKRPSTSIATGCSSNTELTCAIALTTALEAQRLRADECSSLPFPVSPSFPSLSGNGNTPGCVINSVFELETCRTRYDCVDEQRCRKPPGAVRDPSRLSGEEQDFRCKLEVADWGGVC